jgi:hypothetical protein
MHSLEIALSLEKDFLKDSICRGKERIRAIQ